MNKAILIGRLTANPELQHTQSGVSVCRFSIAINRPYKDQNGDTQADFINIVVWREVAENCAKYLYKGRQCAVIGSIQTRQYEDREGQKRYVTEVVAEHVEFLGSKQNGSNEYGEPSAPKQKTTIDKLEPIDDDDLPF